MSHPSLRLLRTSEVTVRLSAVFVSAITIGMMSLTVVLCVVRWTGSFALAGAAGGLFSLGNAAGIALQGRLLDRARAGVVLSVAGAVCLASIVTFVAAGLVGAPPAVVLAAAAVAGCSVPALTAAVRAWLPAVLHTEHERTVLRAAVGGLPGGRRDRPAAGERLCGPGRPRACGARRPPPHRHRDSAVPQPVAHRPAGHPHGPCPHRRPCGHARTAPRARRGGADRPRVREPPRDAAGHHDGTPALSGVAFAAIAVGEMCGALTYAVGRRALVPRDDG